MCESMVDIQFPTAENRQGKKEEEEEERKKERKTARKKERQKEVTTMPALLYRAAIKSKMSTPDSSVHRVYTIQTITVTCGNACVNVRYGRIAAQNTEQT